MKNATIEVVGKNVGRYFYNLGVKKTFLNISQSPIAIKGKKSETV